MVAGGRAGAYGWGLNELGRAGAYGWGLNELGRRAASRQLMRCCCDQMDRTPRVLFVECLFEKIGRQPMNRHV